jgi:hypothetical protein
LVQIRSQLTSCGLWRRCPPVPRATSPAMMIVFAPLSGRAVARFGARLPMVGGGLAILSSGLMLTGVTRARPAGGQWPLRGSSWRCSAT